MNWKARLKRAVPSALLNEALLRLPFLYSIPAVRYETSLADNHGVEDLLSQLELALSLQGDIVECGSSRCGGSVLMARALGARGTKKTIFACDSFQGFDRAELRSEKSRGLANAPDDAFTSTSLDYVQRKLKVLGVDELVRPIPGYFEETLPGLPGPWCFALVDCDLEKSLAFCAEQVWPRLLSGGRIVFDDYECADFAGARLGVDAFVRAHAPEIVEHGMLRRLYVAVKR